jgi:Ca-activated chloride channel family protein
VAIYPNGQYKYDYVKVEIDEDMLKKTAETTGGRYFRATDEKKLRGIYQGDRPLGKNARESHRA